MVIYVYCELLGVFAQIANDARCLRTYISNIDCLASVRAALSLYAAVGKPLLNTKKNLFQGHKLCSILIGWKNDDA